MQFQEIYTNVMGWFKNRPDLTEVLAQRFVNEAYQQMNLSFRFHETDETFDITTVADTSEYDVPTSPADIAVIRKAKIVESGEDLDLRDIDWYDEQLDGAGSDDETSGVPTALLRYGAKIIIYPTPDDVYTIRIRGTKRVEELDLDDDEPVYPPSWHPVIEMLAAARAGFYLGEDSRAVNIKNEALGLVVALQEEPTADQRYRRAQIIPVVRRAHVSRRPRADDPNG